MHYIIKFWVNLTFKCTSSHPGYGLNNDKNRKIISIIFEAYVTYLAQFQEVDGFKNSVLVEEKIEPIPILVRADYQESMIYMISNLDIIENMVKHNVINYKNHLPINEIHLEESDFWEIENIQKTSWVILISAEMLKSHEKVIHKKILQSKNKAEVIADSLEDLTLHEFESKISQVSKLC